LTRFFAKEALVTAASFVAASTSHSPLDLLADPPSPSVGNRAHNPIHTSSKLYGDCSDVDLGRLAEGSIFGCCE
jgi:hypothetical protein